MSRVLEETKDETANDFVELCTVFKCEIINESDLKAEIFDGSLETDLKSTDLAPVKLEEQEYLYDLDASIKGESFEPCQQIIAINQPNKYDINATHDIQSDSCNKNIDITHPNVEDSLYEAIFSTQIEITPTQSNKTVKKSKTMHSRTKRSGKKKDEVLFSCGFCSKFFNSCKVLFSHMIKHRNDLRKTEDKLKQMHSHCSQTPKTKPNKEFNNKKRHVKFKTVAHMLETVDNSKIEHKTKQNDIKTTTSKRNNQCDECGKIFTFYNNLLRHKKKHSDGRVICDYCQKDYNCKSYLAEHIKEVHLKIVKNNTVFKCMVCKKKVKSAYALRGHMRIHTGQKPFKCDVCKKEFSNKWNLQVHCKSMKHNCSLTS